MRYVVIGLGNIGVKRQALIGRRCVATVDPANSAADFRDLGEVPQDVFDAVILAVPNAVKVKLMRELLTQGKHVLVEKPVSFASVIEAEELENLAKRSGAVWYTSYNHRFEPLVMRLKQILDSGEIGTIYHARLVYGNGTARGCIGTWRDEGLGVIEDLGCHLIDLVSYLLGYKKSDFVLWAADAHECRAYDHGVLATPDSTIVMECALTMWKNTFTVDVFGSAGSVHLNGLCKWGQSDLVVRKRVLPSGVPKEQWETQAGPDTTWGADLKEFERRVEAGRTAFPSDLRISHSLESLRRQAAALDA